MLGNSTTDGKVPAASAQQQSFRERGIYVMTLQYTMRDQATGGLTPHRVMIPTDCGILPELRSMYAEMMELAPIIRKRTGRDGRFFLIDRQSRIVGFIILDLSNLSDRDLAWLTCILAETENAVLMELCAEEGETS